MITDSMAAVCLATIAVGCGGSNSGPKARVQGEAEKGSTAALETGSHALQDLTPVNQIGVYLVGFHPMKDNPARQMEAHHYCNQVNEDFAQCVLFDGNTKAANMNGIEYIISEKLFQTLPAGERKYWHPHNYEILSGQLVGPGLPDAAEKAFLTKKMNSYGKTWHVWMTDAQGQHGDALPLGEPHLAWSFNRDGEMNPAMLKDRDHRMQVNTGEKRAQRQDLVPQAHPQASVDDLKGKFSANTKEIAGVTDARGSGGTRPR